MFVHSSWLSVATIQAKPQLHGSRPQSSGELLASSWHFIPLNTVFIVPLSSELNIYDLLKWRSVKVKNKMKCHSCIPMPEINSPQKNTPMRSRLCYVHFRGILKHLVLQGGMNLVIYLFWFTHRAINPGHILRLPKYLILAGLGACALWCSGSMGASSCWILPHFWTSSLWSLLLSLYSNFISLSPFSPLFLPVSPPHTHTLIYTPVSIYQICLCICQNTWKGLKL